MDYNNRIDKMNKILDKVDDICKENKSYNDMTREELTYIAKAMTVVNLETIKLIKKGVWYNENSKNCIY